MQKSATTLFSAIAYAAVASVSYAQTGTTQTDRNPPAVAIDPGLRPGGTAQVPPISATGSDRAGTATASRTAEGSTPEAGANSFTEGQARSRIESAGFSAIEGLTKDEQGIWRGQAMKAGQRSAVSLDFRGTVTPN